MKEQAHCTRLLCRLFATCHFIEQGDTAVARENTWWSIMDAGPELRVSVYERTMVCI